MMLCGYVAETQGWHWGFGLAGIFMLLGTLQFVFAKPLMGNLGVLDQSKEMSQEDQLLADADKRNPFTTLDYILIAIISVVGFLYAFNDPCLKMELLICLVH